MVFLRIFNWVQRICPQTGLCLLSIHRIYKDLKFILYSYTENSVPLENETFKEFSFNEEFNITSKKKMTSLKLNIIQENDSYKLKMNDKNYKQF